MAKPNSWGDPVPSSFPGDVPYPGDDPLLKKYNLEALNEAGYLNINGLSVKEKIKPHDKEAWAASDSKSNPDPIHPILRRARWLGINDKEYESLDPVLRLVSCFLGEPCIMPFFAGLKHLKPLNNPEGEALFNQTLHCFDLYPPENLSSEHIPANLEAWKFLAEQMAPLVTFRFGGNNPNSFASTHAQFDRPGHIKETWGSEIRLASTYLGVFMNVHPANMPYKSHIQHIPAQMRTTVHMATAILHELSHAVVFATIPRTKAEYYKKPEPAEPFFREDRIQEVGLSFQQYLFDGILSPNGPKLLTSCMYGLHMYDFPGAMHKPPALGKVYELQTPKDVGLDEEWHYAVHMDWVRKFMTTAFWEHAALRDEPNSAFKYQRTEYKASRAVTYTSQAASTTSTAPAASTTSTAPAVSTTSTAPDTKDDWTEVKSKRKNNDNGGRWKKKSRG